MIFSAVPGGTVPGCHLYPGLASWATLSRPFGTQFVSRVLTRALKPGNILGSYGPTKVVAPSTTLRSGRDDKGRGVAKVAWFAGWREPQVPPLRYATVPRHAGAGGMTILSRVHYCSVASIPISTELSSSRPEVEGPAVLAIPQTMQP